MESATIHLMLAAAVLLVGTLFPALVAQTAAAQTGSIELTTRVTPSAGPSAPARKVTFYLLRKSFEDARKEAEEAEPKPDLDKFIDGLAVSPELKAWMKRARAVQFTSGDFQRRVTPDDLLDVPEFFEAYITQNAGDPLFPAPRYAERDRERDPQKYERQRKEYREQLRKFARQNPHTMSGMEIHLMEIDAAARWARLEHDRRARMRIRGLDLAQSRYLVSRTDTDLEGRATFLNIPPGDYWLSSLEGDALAGDVRLRWDTPVRVRARRVTRIELSNLNAVSPAGTPH